MIVKRSWYGKWDYSMHIRKQYEGIFLFGIIPLYIKEISK